MNKAWLGLGLGMTLLAGQALGADNAWFGWYGISARGRLDQVSPRLRNLEWSFLNQARLSHNPQPLFKDTANKLSESLLFIQFNYHLSDQFHVGLGYTHDWLDRFNENRPYEELGLRSPESAWGRLTSRTRLEQRVNEKATQDNVGVRLRELVDWSYPIPGLPKVSVRLYDELMWYLNSSTWRNDGFAENRAYGGLDFKLLPKLTLSLGYLNQYVRKGSSKTSQLNHALFTNIDVSF